MKDSLFSQIPEFPPSASELLYLEVRGKKKSWKKGLIGTAARSILDERKEFGCVLAESSEDRLERNCSCPWEVRDEQQPWI